jgi:hypothetical protein
VKKLVPPLLLLLLAMTACIPVLTPVETIPNEPPVAYIDSMSSSRVFEGENVRFVGHGVDPDGLIVAYSWRSSLDGELSSEASFETSSLSPGRNTIYFKVQDNWGDWSKEKYQYITVIPEGTVKPIINRFDANPKSFIKGESVLLTWDVSGAKTVSIDPGIGDVSISGSRDVYPESNTKYVLTATNEAGDSTFIAEVKFISDIATNIVTYAIPAESGNVRYTSKVGSVPMAGDLETNYAVQAFLSFDISMIPKGATIKSASLDLSNMNVVGEPFSLLGAMAVFNDQYGDLDLADFVYGEDVPGGYPGSAIVVTYTRPMQPYNYDTIAEAVQTQVDKGTSRFQIRIQFERNYARDRKADLIELIPEVTKLTVKYE